MSGQNQPYSIGDRREYEAPPMEADPLDVVEKNESGRDEQFTKALDVNADLFVLLEVDAALRKQLDTLRSVHVFG